MEIKVETVDQVIVVQIEGDIDGNTASEAQARILPLAKADCKIILDMDKVPFMSSAGLRLLLVTYRTIKSKGGNVVLVGLSEDIEDTMEMTGFLDFFDYYESLDAGLAALA